MVEYGSDESARRCPNVERPRDLDNGASPAGALTPEATMTLVFAAVFTSGIVMFSV
jgi:hypothetical protein